METQPHEFGRVLLITGTSRDASAILQSLESAERMPFQVEWARSLSDGIERLKSLSYEAAILDLSLPDSAGIETFVKVFSIAPRIPILILSDEEEAAQEAVRQGARDYLPRNRLDSYSVPRAVRNVIALKAATDIMAGNRERAEDTLNSIGDGILSTDIKGNITYLNAVAEKMTGWKVAEAVGRPSGEVFQFVDRTTHKPARNPLLFAMERGHAVGLTPDCLLIRRDGVESAIEDSSAPIRNNEGHVIGAVLVFRDVGEARALASKMSHMAQHDFLTELPNRILLSDRLGQAIEMGKRHHKKLGVLFLDLDRFKAVNDSMSHATGDVVLKAIAKRLTEALRGTDTVSRYGGDEFVILLPEIDGAGDACVVAKKILQAMAEPHAIEGRQLQVTASIGVSIFPDNGEEAQLLIHCADTAMYEAKKTGGHSFSFYEGGYGSQQG